MAYLYYTQNYIKSYIMYMIPYVVMVIFYFISVETLYYNTYFERGF